MALNPIVEQVLTSGLVQNAAGEPVPAHSFIPREECMLIDRAIGSTGATSAVEVGMAFGVSTITIADALRRNAKGQTSPRLVVMDPHQNAADGWNGLGLLQIERAGLRAMVEFHERPSHECLPDLLLRGCQFDFGFIDGWHTFDHTLIDFFYVDRMLRVGGAIVFDDIGYPAIHAVLRFVLANRSYELADVAHADPYHAPWGLLFKRRLKEILRSLARTDRDPSDEHRKLFGRLADIQAVAIVKTTGDHRRFDHFAPF